MRAYELTSHRTTTGVKYWACGQCGELSRSFTLAELCCSGCKSCGGPRENELQVTCCACQRARRHEILRKRLDEASEVEWDGVSMLHSFELQNSYDGWYASLDDVLEEIEERIAEDKDFEPPEFVFAGCPRQLGINLGGEVERMLEDMPEGTEFSEVELGKLQKAVDEFNARNSIVVFDVDYDHKVRIPIHELYQ